MTVIYIEQSIAVLVFTLEIRYNRVVSQFEFLNPGDSGDTVDTVESRSSHRASVVSYCHRGSICFESKTLPTIVMLPI